MKNTQDAINAIRKGDPLNHNTIQEIGDMLEDLQNICKERGEKLGRLRHRIEAEEARNFQLEEALKGSRETLCELRTMVESEGWSEQWSHELFGRCAQRLLLSEKVYEGVHVANERALTENGG